MYEIVFTNRMKRDAKRMQKRGKDMRKLASVLDALAGGSTLPDSCRDHALAGSFAGFRECHVEPDWLLIYRIEKTRFILTATATGTHADLFDL